MAPSITVITPTVRPELAEIVGRCLARQTFKDFEWIIIKPLGLNLYSQPPHGPDISITFVHDPPKLEGDYYALNKAWNAGFKQAQGALIVSIQDGVWFPPDLLERFWLHYQLNSKALVTAVGNQYERLENGKPEGCVWADPRRRADFGSFYEVSPRELEFCVASISKQAIIDVGGIDEEFDKYAALSEKEMCYRMDRLGYKFYIDQTLEYRALKHPRLSEEWDERYLKGCEYYTRCLDEIAQGRRLHLEFLGNVEYKEHKGNSS